MQSRQGQPLLKLKGARRPKNLYSLLNKFPFSGERLEKSGIKLNRFIGHGKSFLNIYIKSTSLSMSKIMYMIA